MKLKRRTIKRGRVEIIPMIDTIVILLIFYMTFARFASANKSAKIALPEALAGTEITNVPGQIIINMITSDEVLIGEEEFKVAELAGRLRGWRTGLAAGTKPSVILRGDKKMTYKDLSEFMNACAKAGIIDVTFATLEQSRR